MTDGVDEENAIVDLQEGSFVFCDNRTMTPLLAAAWAWKGRIGRADSAAQWARGIERGEEMM